VLAVVGLAWEEQRRKGVLFSIFGLVVSLPVLFLALLSPETLGSYGQRRRIASPDNKTQYLFTFRHDAISEPLRPLNDEPVPMDKGAVRLGDAQVRVLRAILGEVATKGQPKNPLPEPKVSSAPEKQLTIVVRIANVGTGGGFSYQSWGAALQPGSPYAPVLRDDRGGSYKLKNFAGGVTVPGRFRIKELTPGKAVNDYLVFPQPRAGAAYYLLELPASGFGEEGTMKFKILPAKIVRADKLVRFGP
jgi:hypothetical protein